ncbi:sodium:alanine symporter family protein [Corynebacterium sp. CCUG 61414]|uniref:alanine/glycine:cation symporter family protein n=1 Tax=Corynebacterium sp. CCUG 61414 TaxID=2823896 RepID=UPI00210D6BF2|nr:sodium:alanine symporter family protein [Corynebacterium sp. CCUG 61414]MCQ4610757.1 sodium:alanine symporter family protein [Corynebacterium sp. CCUG 61414]
MAAQLNEILGTIASFVWGPFLLIPLLLGTGLFLTVRMGGIQFRTLGRATRHAFVDKNEEGSGDISNYQALTTALAATVGTGNIVGVATAISIGGPGSLLWIWVTGIVGMASKYSEAYLGVRFRTTDDKGRQQGGPHEYLRRGIPGPLGSALAVAFMLFTIFASFGIGNLTQGNSIAAGMQEAFGIEPTVSGILIFIGVGAAILGGIEGIGKITAAFVPLMIVLYVGGGIVALALMADQIPAAISLIFHDAFTGSAATGGFVGSTIMMAIQFGVARGIFSNESGMGSAAIAAAAAKTQHPTRQALVSMTQTFIDTLIVVTITGLVIVTSGTWDLGRDEAAVMTARGFSTVLPGTWGGDIVSVSLIFFAFSTILGWSYYGERAATALFGQWASLPYKMFFTAVAFLGATTHLELVWTFSDLANGLMAIPNLIGLLLLSGLVARETREYLKFDPKLRRSPEEVAVFVKQQGMNWE